MSTDTRRPRFPVKELIAAGPNAAAVLVRHTVQTAGLDIQERAQAQRTAADFDVEGYVDRLIKSQLMLARAEGAGAGAVTTAAEFSSLVTGPAAVVVVATTVLTDMAALAVIQVRLSLMIAAAYGHDMEDVDGRVREVLALHSLEMQAARVAGPVVATSGRRVGRRLLMRYLRGPLLQSLKSVFKLVGINLSRAALIRGLPLVNIPANATVADVTTRRCAKKARDYYRLLPNPAGTHARGW